MEKIISIDYGLKLSGISITNNENSLALGLKCLKTDKIFFFLKNIIKKEYIKIIVIGFPIKLNNKYQNITKKVLSFKKKLLILFPEILVELIDERYTSKIANTYIKNMNFKKKKKEKKNIISSILILQTYLNLKKKKII
ncbi:MAG: Holliday junction resolvase RuvX [Candidatus Shikimatogenerans sp. JK-2022]|nr:Holliday junction resolvase RuvX [Candidatus Shikimatogenerans bostrichidophilus]